MMTPIKDPIRQASLFTTWGLVDPRLMQDYVEKPADESNSTQPSSSWWMKIRIADFFTSGKKTANA